MDMGLEARRHGTSRNGKAISGWDGLDGWISECTYTKSTYGAKNGIRDACSTADCCPLLSIVVFLFLHTFEYGKSLKTGETTKSLENNDFFKRFCRFPVSREVSRNRRNGKIP